MTSVEEKLTVLTEGRVATEVIHLDLSNTESNGTLEGLNAFENLETLKISSAGIKTLGELPALKNLKTVDLSNNLVEDLQFLIDCVSLFTLDLSNNQIKDTSVFKSLSGIESLKYLLVRGNPLCCESDNYRNQLFDLLPHVDYIDSVNRNGQTCNDENSKITEGDATVATGEPQVTFVETSESNETDAVKNSVEAHGDEEYETGADNLSANNGDNNSTLETSDGDVMVSFAGHTPYKRKFTEDEASDLSKSNGYENGNGTEDNGDGPTPVKVASLIASADADQAAPVAEEV